jgi:diguanylate cyclase (GGDEF)-like protein
MGQKLQAGCIDPAEIDRLHQTFIHASADLARDLHAGADNPAIRRFNVAAGMAFDVARRSIRCANEALEDLRTIHRIARIGNWRVRLDDHLTFWSEDMHELFGTDPEHFVPLFDVLTGQMDEADRATFLSTFRTVAETGQAAAAEIRIRGAEEGARRWFWIDMRPEADEAGAIVAVRGICQEITDRKVALERIRYMSSHDPLTNLVNRTHLLERLDQILGEARRRRENVALLTFDIDDFKGINDLFGHAVADSVLREIAGRIARQVRESDLVARIGGDEFVVVQAGCEQPELVETLARRLLRAIAEPIVLADGREIGISASVGIALHPFDGMTPGALLAHSSQALHVIKKDRPNTLGFYDASIQSEWQKRRALEQDLRLALQHRELSLVYQPMFCMRSSLCSGFEALLRWHSPTHGPVSPDLFIGLAESIGLMEEVGTWVLREACAEAARWAVPLTIAVNVSPIQIQQGDLASVITETLNTTGLPPNRLEIEVTESMLIRNFDRAVDTLQRIKALGVGISIDDFGTGYSSLATLRAFPFNKLKIDRSFVRDLAEESESLAIINAVLGLGRGLRLPVVVEGVETERQADILRDCGADAIQGYLFGRPSPISAYSTITDPRMAAGRRVAV